MRKLTPREIASICAAVGVCSLGRAHAASLPEVVIQGCQTCGDIGDVVWTPPADPGGPAFTPTLVTINVGAGSPPASVLIKNNPDCNTPKVNAATIQNQILGAEGGDAQVEGMGEKYYSEGTLTNETGYVPANSANNPSSTSGATFLGVDLGQYTVAQLENSVHVPASIVDLESRLTIQPGYYITIAGHKEYVPGGAPLGQTALNLINGYTVNGQFNIMTAAQANTQFQDVYNYILDNFTNFLATVDGVTFGQLPANTQAALLDYAWNNSDGYLSETGPTATAYDDVPNEDWGDLADLLMITGGQRGGEEAKLIYDDIIAQKLPSKGDPC